MFGWTLIRTKKLQALRDQLVSAERECDRLEQAAILAQRSEAEAHQARMTANKHWQLKYDALLNWVHTYVPSIYWVNADKKEGQPE